MTQFTPSLIEKVNTIGTTIEKSTPLIVESVSKSGEAMTEAVINAGVASKAQDEINNNLLQNISNTLSQNRWILFAFTLTVGIIIYKKKGNQVICNCNPISPSSINTSPNLDPELIKEKINELGFLPK